jgi:hypothetical protein
VETVSVKELFFVVLKHMVQRFIEIQQLLVDVVSQLYYSVFVALKSECTFHFFSGLDSRQHRFNLLGGFGRHG